MNELEILKHLAEQARSDAPPAVDVRKSVMHAIRADVVAPMWDRALLACAAASVCVGLVGGAFAMETWDELNSPAMEVVQMFETVLQ